MTPIRMEKIESASRLVMSFTEAFNRHDIPALMQFIRDDCLLEAASPTPDGEVCRGKAAILSYFQGLFTRFPQACIKIEELLGYGFRCIVRWRCSWADASGNPAHVRGICLLRVQQDLIAEIFAYIKG